MPDQFTSGGTPAGGTPPLSTAGPGGGILPGRSTVHNAANNFVQQYQKPFEAKLAQIGELAKTDPGAARQQLGDAWQQFLSDVEAFQTANPVTGYRITSQALNEISPSVAGYFGVDVNAIAPTGTGGTRFSLPWWQSVLIGLQQSGVLQKKTANVGGSTSEPAGGGGSTGNAPVTTTAPAGGATTSPGGGLPGGGQGPVNPAGGNGLPAEQSFWAQLAPYLPFIGSTFANIYGAVTTSNAAKEAAAATLEATRQSTELQRGIYNQNRSDSMPWLNTGTKAVYRLSDLMGLPPGPRTMPNTQGVGPITLSSAAPGVPSPAQTAMAANSTGGGGPMEGDTMQQGAPLDLRAMAARYKRPAVRTV